MLKKKQPFQYPAQLYPPFVNDIMEKTRALADKDGIVRVQTDNTITTVVTFTATWYGKMTSRTAKRRVFLQTKLTETNQYLLIFSADHLASDPETKEFSEADFDEIPKTILRYLRIGSYE